MNVPTPPDAVASASASSTAAPRRGPAFFVGLARGSFGSSQRSATGTTTGTDTDAGTGDIPAFSAPAIAQRLQNFRRRSRMPKYRSLPRGLLWPNPQVSVMIVFAGGVTESATAIIGAAIVGYDMPLWSIALAALAVLVVLAFVDSQALTLLHFYRSHRSECWVPAEVPSNASEVEDPVLRLLCKVKLLKPRAREQGEWAMPEVDAQEPQRTELDLAEAFNCGLGFRQTVARCCFDRSAAYYDKGRSSSGASDHGGGHSLERLQGWTREGSASKAGAALSLIIIGAQLLLALNTGLLFVVPWSRTSAGQKLRLIVNALIQAFCALFTAGPAVNDVLNGAGLACVFALECAATLCLLASTFAVDGVPAVAAAIDDANVSSVAASINGTLAADDSAAVSDDPRLAGVSSALALASTSAALLSASIFVPLVLTLYDGILVPIAGYVSKQDGGTPGEIFCSILVALVVLPLQLAKSFLGINADVADVVSEYSDMSMEVTSKANQGEEIAAAEVQRRLAFE